MVLRRASIAVAVWSHVGQACLKRGQVSGPPTPSPRGRCRTPRLPPTQPPLLPRRCPFPGLPLPPSGRSAVLGWRPGSAGGGPPSLRPSLGPPAWPTPPSGVGSLQVHRRSLAPCPHERHGVGQRQTILVKLPEPAIVLVLTHQPLLTIRLTSLNAYDNISPLLVFLNAVPPGVAHRGAYASELRHLVWRQRRREWPPTRRLDPPPPRPPAPTEAAMCGCGGAARPHQPQRRCAGGWGGGPPAGLPLRPPAPLLRPRRLSSPPPAVATPWSSLC